MILEAYYTLKLSRLAEQAKQRNTTVLKLIQDALIASNGDKTKAARLLGVSDYPIHYHLRRAGLRVRKTTVTTIEFVSIGG